MTANSRVVQANGLSFDDRQLIALFNKAVKKREKLYTVTNAVRLFNSTADGLSGLIIEQYNRHFMIKKLLPLTGLDLGPLVEALREQFDPQYLVIKTRDPGDTGTLNEPAGSEVVIKQTDSQTIVTENGLQFAVDVNDNYNAGLFLDMRSKRQALGRLARGKAVLNCFAYTCSFGVYCRFGGATKTVNADISKKSLERGRNNYQLNGLEYKADEFVRTDCIKYLKGAHKWQNYFDLVIIDPPTFARVDKKIFAIQKELPRLITAAAAVLKQAGYLFIATNCSLLGSRQVEQMLKAAVQTSNKRLLDFTFMTQEEDFPGSQAMKESYLVAVLAKLEGGFK